LPGSIFIKFTQLLTPAMEASLFCGAVFFVKCTLIFFISTAEGKKESAMTIKEGNVAEKIIHCAGLAKEETEKFQNYLAGNK